MTNLSASFLTTSEWQGRSGDSLHTSQGSDASIPSLATQFIGPLANSPEWLANDLTDGRHACQYQDLPTLFSRLGEELARQGVERGDCLAVACENSLPCALVILYLLEQGQDFLLFSRAQGKGVPTPGFCRYRLAIADPDSADPVASLRTERNRAWNGESTPFPPRIYLRTSSTTGAAKMVAYTHVQIYANGLNCVERLEIGSEDSIAIPVPIYHMFGLGAAFLPAVAVGASIDLQNGANLLGYIERERQFNPTVAFMTPTFGETLLKGRRSDRAYRLTVMAGDRLKPDSFDRYGERFGPLVQLYGSTEMGAIAASGPGDDRALRRETVGRPLSNVQMRLEQSGVEIGGDIGELWCRHAHGSSGYVDDAGTLLPHPGTEGWYATRDLGRIRPDGRLQVLGRADHSVNRSGLLVMFADVEKALASIEGVDSAAVVSRGESHYGKGLVAFCVIGEGMPLTGTDIRAACFARLPKRAIPDAIHVIPALPLLPNGKLDRQTLIRLAGEGHADLA